MTPPAFNYELSYFRPNKESSVEIKINTHGQEINGFQLVIDVSANPGIDIVDQNSALEYPQLSIASMDGLSFLTNKAIPTENGYQIAIAAITSNPKKPFITGKDTVVASLIFTQPSEGEIIISNDDKLTKISTILTSNEDSLVVKDSTPITISTISVGTKPTFLIGEIYSPPTDLQPTQNSNNLDNQVVDDGNSIPTPIIVGAVVILALLIGVIMYLVKKLNKRSSPPPTQLSPSPTPTPQTQSDKPLDQVIPTQTPQVQPFQPQQTQPEPPPPPPGPSQGNPLNQPINQVDTPTPQTVGQPLPENLEEKRENSS